MRENSVKQTLSRGGTVFGTMIQEVRNPAIAKILANAGFDFMFIDMEHGAYDLEGVADICLVARLAGIVPLVRVPDPLYHLIARVLDNGAQGIMIPRVETREQVADIVDCVKYPPDGRRGCSTGRGSGDFRSSPLRDFTEHMNQHNLVVLQIERRRAVEDIDSLLSIPGVDVALIGPNDLALSLGARATTEPVVAEAIETVIASASRHGVASGIHIRDVKALKEWMRKGMRMITVGSDVEFLMDSATRSLSVLREP